MAIRGGCLCGAVAFEIRGRISPIQTCLCSRCRKASGSAFGASLLCATKSFAWVRGQAEITTYPLSTGFVSAFCRFCGSPLPMPTMEGKVKAIPAGCLDGDLGTRILRHTFVGSKADWFELADSLPRHDEFAPQDPAR